MKSFYSMGEARASVLDSEIDTASRPHSSEHTYIGMRARVAVYDAPGAAPRVEDVAPAPVPEYIENLTTRVYELAREQGGTVPYTAIREVSENFIHADFADPVVSIMDGGMTIRFADQGPGIADKERAVLPGFTTAKGDMKRYIRGVGSGLPIVRDYLSYSGGSLLIEDNLGSGSVVTLRARASDTHGAGRPGFENGPTPSGLTESFASDGTTQESFPLPSSASKPRLSTRQKHVLALVMESGSAGPSLVAKELGVGVSTAYRDLASLEDMGLICSDGGKRTLTDEGLVCFDHLVTR